MKYLLLVLFLVFLYVPSICQNIKLTYPNHGGKFPAGSNINITWSGVESTDTVIIEYSIKSITKWNLITNEATNNQFLWKNIPNLNSKECLIRITKKYINDNNKDSVLTINAHKMYVSSVAFSPNAKLLITGGGEGIAKIWNAKTGQLIHNLVHDGSILSVAFNSNGDRVVTGSFDHTAKIWNVYSGEEQITLKGHKKGINSVIFSPDGTLVYTGSDDNSIKIWDSSNGDLLRTFEYHNGPVRSLSLNEDGTYLISSSDDSSAIIWDVLRSTVLKIYYDNKPINSAAFIPNFNKIFINSSMYSKIWVTEYPILYDSIFTLSSFAHINKLGTHFVNGTNGYKLQIWNFNTKKVDKELLGHNSFIMDAVFSEDCTKILSGDIDGVAKIWDIKDLIKFSDTSDYYISIEQATDGIENQLFLNSISIHPNPAQNHIIFDLINTEFNDSQNINFKLVNKLGECVIEKDLTNISNQKVNIDLGNVSSGVYYGLLSNNKITINFILNVLK